MPVGRRLGWSAEERSELEIVGVVGDVKYSQVREAAPPTIYVPYTQHRVSSMVFEVKTAGDPNQLVPSVREAIRSVDPKVPLMDVSTQTEQIDNRFRQERFFAIAYSAFGGLAALLAAIGLFGLASYGVAQRTNEIGVRMALGANRGDVVRMVVTESLVLVAVGVAIGIVGALVGGQLVSNLLFDVAPANPLTMAAATMAMILVSSIAAFFPARRAARIDPMSALHYE